MASPSIPDTSEIRRRGRRRLVGAIVIVLLLVVFVPMLLDSEPRPTRPEPALAIPPKDNAPPLPPPTPAAAPKAAPVAESKPAAAPVAESKSATVAATKPAAVAETKPAPVAAPKPTPAAEEKPAAKPKAAPAPAKVAAAPKLEGFAISVGAFRDEAKLKQAREKLAAAGVVHYTERLEGQGGTLTRLRAGPFPTREAAEAHLAKTRAIASDAKVIPLP